MAEQPFKPVLQKPPGFHNPGVPVRPGPNVVQRKPVLPQSFRPRKRRRNWGRICCRYLCVLIMILLVIVAVASTLFYLWFIPQLPVFHLQSFRIPRFNVAVKPDGTYLDAQTVLRVEIKNPNNKLSLFYQHGRVTVTVGGEADPTELGSKDVDGFTQKRRNITSLKVETVVKNQVVDDGDGSKLKARFQSKGLVVSVEVQSGLGFIVEGLKIGPLGVKVLCGGVSLKRLESGDTPSCTINTLKW
ncbi:NDR1/HIN1-like protein 6 [Fagus crenata]